MDDVMVTVKRLLTLVALIAFGYLVVRLDAPAHHRTTATVLLGFILLVAYIAGAAAAGFTLPRVTGYVLVGIVVGPYALGIFTEELVESLRTIDELALALIALTAGGELKVKELRRSFRAIVGMSFGIVGFVVLGLLVLVLAAKPLVPSLAELSWRLVAAQALVLAIWAANSSPDATIAVINESGAEGEVTDTILGVTIFKDVVVIVLFAVGLSVAGPLAGDAAFAPGLIGVVAWEVLGAFVVGGVLGWVFSLYLVRNPQQTVLVTLLFAYIIVLVSHAVHVELLLAAVGAGFVIENFSEAGDRFINGIEANSLVVFAIFFALAGAALDLGTVVTYWSFAAVIVVVRGVLTWLGATVGARATDASRPVVRLGWMGLISQAGVTLGLSLLVAREFPEWGTQFVAITTAVIIVHLLVGPVLLKVALTRAGEAGDGADTSKRELLRSDIVAEQGGA